MKGLIVAFVALTALVGCGDKKNDNQGGGGVDPYANGYGYGNACPVPGQVPTQAGCLNQGFCPPGQGQYNNQCLQALVGQQYGGGYNGMIPPGGYPGGQYQQNPGLGYPPSWGGGYNGGYYGGGYPSGGAGFYWQFGSRPGYYSYY